MPEHKRQRVWRLCLPWDGAHGDRLMRLAGLHVNMTRHWLRAGAWPRESIQCLK